MGKHRFQTCSFMVGLTLTLGSSAIAQPVTANRHLDGEQTKDALIVVDGVSFSSWEEYAGSDLFRKRGLRCGTNPSGMNTPIRRGSGAEDCTFSLTNPDAVYDPSVVKYAIPVVVHVIRKSDGVTGHIRETMVQSQIDILNEDFLAIPGTNGANGTDIQIEFYLATEKPDGTPTNGITYSDNNTWYNDGGSYWNVLAWDTNRYLNIYTNSASGALGYVPDLPQGGIVGSNADRVVILWSTFGRNGPFGPPYNQGRTVTHEVGHYLGLDHPWGSGGCPSATGCYSNGDLVCDTNPQSSPTFGCFSANTCGTADSIRNYLDYSDDLCMEEFTPDQARRMRCSLQHYRPNLLATGSTPVAPPSALTGEPGFDKDRYVSIDPTTNGTEAVAIRVLRVGSTTNKYVDCTSLEDKGADGFYATLIDGPLPAPPDATYYCDLSSVTTGLHVRGCSVVPGNTYDIAMTTDGTSFSVDLSIPTTPPQFPARQYGDTVGSLVGGAWTAPDGIVTTNDIAAAVKKFGLDPDAAILARLDTEGSVPNAVMSSGDILRAVTGFAGQLFGSGVTGCATGTCVPPQGGGCE